MPPTHPARVRHDRQARRPNRGMEKQATCGHAFERRTVSGRVDDSQCSYQISCRWLSLCALLTAACGMLASCDTPIGVSPALQGTYRATSLVTNPDGDGPQVVRWGPPEGVTGRH